MPSRALLFLSLATASLVPAVTEGAPRTFSDLVNYLVFLLNNFTALLILLGIVVYFWGIATNILKMKDEGSEKVKAYFFWGVIVLFVMVSIWGIVRLLQNTLFGSDASGYAPAQEGVFVPPSAFE